MKKSQIYTLIGLLLTFGTIGYAATWKEKVAKNNVPKTVRLDTYGTKEMVMFDISFGTKSVHDMCTGVCIDSRGSVLTAAHCLTGEGFTLSSMTITTSDFQVYEMSLRAISDQMDLAIIVPKYDYKKKFPYASLSKAYTVSLGEDVLAIGHPLGFYYTVSAGIISCVNRILVGGAFVQFDAVIASGSSGGPVFNSKGELVGIVSRYRTGPMGSLTGLNFMVGPPEIRILINAVHSLFGTDLRVQKRTRQYRLGDIRESN